MGRWTKQQEKQQIQKQGKLVCELQPSSLIFLNDRTNDVNALNIVSSAVFLNAGVSRDMYLHPHKSIAPHSDGLQTHFFTRVFLKFKTYDRDNDELCFEDWSELPLQVVKILNLCSLVLNQDLFLLCWSHLLYGSRQVGTVTLEPNNEFGEINVFKM